MTSFSVTALANSNNTQFNNNLKNVKATTYTCTYEYYQEVIDGSGITYVFVGAEVVECGAEDAGQVFMYVATDGYNLSGRSLPKGPGGKFYLRYRD
ncbi:MAG: hypothetical protein E2600_12665 [Chryseobacterium sp.]|nr:hypothetical protein [Chryseobacterium sp.]